jgi:hypothetical protein
MELKREGIMKTSTLIKIGGAIISFAILSGCTLGGSSNNDTSQGSLGASQIMQAKIAVTISQNGSTVYSDSVPNSSLNLTAGQTYDLNLNVTGAPVGTTYSLKITQTDVVNGPTTTVALVNGSNVFTVPSQGDFSWTVVATAAAYAPLSKIYQAVVQCSQPTFTASSLTASAITVTSGSGQNLYNYSAAGVIAGANGLPPYQCAWDPTGTGIVDTGFGDCATTLQNVYVNYVGMREVGVIVKDSCNSTYAVNNLVNLSYTEPTMPGNVFIFGQVSGATGAASTDARVNNVTYLATNAVGNDIVQPLYGSGNFDIHAYQNYGEPSSVKFGMDIKVTGIVDSINVSAGTGTISATAATISQVLYSTDESGDEDPATSFAGSSCVLSNQGATVKFVAGQPCSAGQTGDNNMATVEVWGHYVCTGLSNSNGSINITGDFDGFYDLVDNCSGGGGGGGGIVPIQL